MWSGFPKEWDMHCVGFFMLSCLLCMRQWSTSQAQHAQSWLGHRVGPREGHWLWPNERQAVWQGDGENQEAPHRLQALAGAGQSCCTGPCSLTSTCVCVFLFYWNLGLFVMSKYVIAWPLFYISQAKAKWKRSWALVLFILSWIQSLLTTANSIHMGLQGKSSADILSA